MTSSYMCEPGAGQQIVIESQGTQTSVTQISGGAGQQQSQRRSFTTGEWTMPPTLFRTSSGLVLRVEGAQGQFFLELQGQQTQLLDTPPSLSGAEVLSLRQATPPPAMQPMKPMEPMKPMQMQMQMGTMQMQMGLAGPTEAGERFCAQCGQPAAKSAHFCTRCGHRLET